MRKTLIFSFLLFSIFQVSCQTNSETTQVILVRHAEKGTDDPENPHLNEAGKARASKLFELFKEQEVNAVYSTNYFRTQETVVKIAEHNNIEIRFYNDFSEDYWASILEENKGKTILISGHSNTTPQLVNLFLGKEKLQQLTDDDYGNIFIISASELGKGSLLRLRH